MSALSKLFEKEISELTAQVEAQEKRIAEFDAAMIDAMQEMETRRQNYLTAIDRLIQSENTAKSQARRIAELENLLSDTAQALHDCSAHGHGYGTVAECSNSHCKQAAALLAQAGKETNG